MGEKIPHHANLRDVLLRGADHLKAAIDCGVMAACLWLEDHAGDQGETSKRIERETAPASSDEPLMTVEDLAAYLKIKPQTLRDWAKKGRIPYEPVNSEIRFRRSVIDKWIEANRAKKSSPPQTDAVVKSGRSFLRPANHRSKSNGRF